MAREGTEWPVRPAWARRRVGVLKPRKRVSGSGGRTYDDPVVVGGTIEKLTTDEIESGDTESGDEVIKLSMMGTPFTRSIGQGWAIDIHGDRYSVKQIDRADQFKVTIQAKRLNTQ